MAFAGSWVRATDVGIFFTREVLSLARDKGRRRSMGQQCLTRGGAGQCATTKTLPPKGAHELSAMFRCLEFRLRQRLLEFLGLTGKVDIQHELTKDEYHAFLHPNQDRDSYAGKGQVCVCFR